MRVPTTSIINHLRWTDSGTVWADWILTGHTYLFASDENKRSVRDAHTAFYRSLPGESLLLGIHASIDPSSVVERMLDGVDLDQCPLWGEEVLATYDTLTEIPLGERIFWLSVPLGQSSWLQRLRATSEAAKTKLLDQMGAPRRLPDEKEVAGYMSQAADIERRLVQFSPRRATAAQMMWLHQHMLDRGLVFDDTLPQPGDLASDLAVSAGPRAVIGQPLLDEGGQTDFPRGRLRNPSAFNDRLLKVTDVSRAQDGSSYQALGVITKPPLGGMVFPGSEMLGTIGSCGLTVDWAQRIQVVGRDTTATANQRALDQIADQVFHTGGDDDTNIARNTNLSMQEDSLRDYVGVLAADELELECRTTTILAVGADSRPALRELTTALSDYISAWHHDLLWPLGQQEDLWWAMHPGAPTSQTVREYQQITTTKNAASLVPMISTTAGNTRGSALALNLANGPLLEVNLPCGPAGLVMHDLDGASARDTVGSMAISAESGAGKSVALKKLTDASLDQGGIAIIVDRTEMGEYALWAEARGDVSVVEIVDPKFSFDPLRLFPGSEGSRVMQSFLIMLLNIKANDEFGASLAEVLDPHYRRVHGLDSGGAVLEHLISSSDETHLELAKKIRVFSRNDLGRVVFDPTLPTPDTTKSMVIRTNRLRLPKASTLANKHTFDQMSVEEIFGRAYYALVTGYARTVCFRDRTRQGVFVMDELTAQIVSPEVEDYLVEFNIDGRKHRAALLVGSQYVSNGGLGTERLANSFPTRMVMRMRNEKLARPALEWMLGHAPEEELVDIITKDTSPAVTLANGDEFVEEHRRGEMVMVDSQGRCVRGKILAANQAKRREAAMATGFKGAK
ncbi:MAG: ATP-binding protein [Luteococcus sp.]|uniref:ATP-binding protein n=1 Tax=Luteococcus sp. TaxID=1969402 RepID=UPI00264A29C8|nr:ATP-binding protein [Luteococcus sp.]MDN5562556.1 ATP-binding protein [Luteococcus sp.]